ncbi:tetratricopeptide repeat protein [Candidatus Sumerlaeota bacterium]
MLAVGALCLCALWLTLPREATAAREPKKRSGGGDSEQAKMDFKANDMLARGIELLTQKQEERGLKLIESVIKSYPSSPVRFKAHLAMGDYHRDKRSYDVAVKQFLAAAESETPEEIANALYQAGICYYQLNQLDKAFVTLRKVTSDFPWSVYANEAYYYIGLCHFKLKRWSRAFEALELVGTSVPSETAGEIVAEAGQRLFVKVDDLDLIVARETGELPTARLEAKSGDRETITLEPLGKSGHVHLGSIRARPGAPKPDDGELQTIGGDTVAVTYTDENTEEGASNQQRASSIRLVSTAAIGFVDGAYGEYRKGLFGDQEAFIRVKDLDRDTSNQPDTLDVEVRVQYKEKREVDLEKTGIVFDEEEEVVKVRSSARVMLTESGPHTGVFIGAVPIAVATPEQRAGRANGSLWAMRDDQALLRYTDNEHLAGNGPRTAEFTARIVVGEIRDVKVEHRQVSSLELKARKNLIEARILLKLSQIFKEVGLLDKAQLKADEALERVNTVISASLRASLERSVVEGAFSAKWDLLIVKDDLRGAIAVCRDLIRLFPDSSLVDHALMKIAVAKIESGGQGEVQEAIGILHSIQQLPKSDLKAEAQFRIAEIEEQHALKSARKDKHGKLRPNFSNAMTRYKECADKYPESLYAGRSLDKICNYYINIAKDYGRAIELLEQVFQDYPDASFLDKMLYKWIVAAYRSGQYRMAADKCAQLLAEYPESESAKKALKYQQTIERKLES